MDYMTINWTNLRPWKGSQHLAFEELCCQLAANEASPPGARFTRKGTQDAGVECYWKLKNGDEWGWQAKFFTSTPNSNQWRQINKSVKTALQKHPELTRYIICLPNDRGDPKIEEQESFMVQWNKHVEKWEKWANEDERSVEFGFWGEHEIFERLSKEEHRGRHYFWFAAEFFSNQWFKDRVNEAIEDSDPRYTPKLSVDLPISQLFEGLGRTKNFYTRVRVLAGRIKKELKLATPHQYDKNGKDIFDKLNEHVVVLLGKINEVRETGIELFDWERIVDTSKKAIDLAQDCQTYFRRVRKETEKSSGKKNPEHQRLGYESYYIEELMRSIIKLLDFAKSSEAKLANISSLLLVGEAGTGKTHLFCDVTKHRVGNKLPSVLLLGQQFTNQEPWSQIIGLLGLDCTRDEFLGALDASAQARKRKALILIDALNEGEGKSMWAKHLAGMLSTIKRYPWISIAISVRSSYEDLIIPESLIPDKLVKEVHPGFAEREYEGTRTFFDFFDIEQPSIPMIIPAFQNPLFLKIFCLGLKNAGETKLPTGIGGISEIFDNFLKYSNKRLSKEEFLDLDPKENIVGEAVNQLVKSMAASKNSWVPLERAKEILEELLPDKGYHSSLLYHLLSEGIIMENRVYKGNDQWVEGVQFPYEKFSDHLIAKYLLETNLPDNDPKNLFEEGGPLHKFLMNEEESWKYQGIIEAFSIQFAEKIGMELSEVCPHAADYETVKRAFIESLIWRDPEATTDATLNYINNHIAGYEDLNNRLLGTFLTICSNPKHQFNAEFLHRQLMKYSLAERDAWWTIYLYHHYGEHEAIDRILDWCWSREDKSHIDDEAILLLGIALAWFMTSSHRYLRDRTTKALVN